MYKQLLNNGMLTKGEVRHCTCWEYPTMSRLHRAPVCEDKSKDMNALRDTRSRNRGYIVFFFDMLRSK